MKRAAVERLTARCVSEPIESATGHGRRTYGERAGGRGPRLPAIRGSDGPPIPEGPGRWASYVCKNVLPRGSYSTRGPMRSTTTMVS